MPRDDELDDARPRRRRPRDEEDEDRPRRRRDDDDGDRPPPRKKSNTGLILGILVGVFLVCCGGGVGVGYILINRAKKGLEQVVAGVQDSVEADQSAMNLRQIGTGIHNYHDVNQVLPHDTRDDIQKGKLKPTYRPLLSWRVHILPYIGEDALFKRFKLDEPWDSANNKPLVSQMPAIYVTPEAAKRAGPGKTYYRGFTHSGAIFEKSPQGPPMKVRFTGIPDGLTNTLMVVEAGEAVEWTKPDDFDWSPKRPRPALGGITPNLPYFQILMANGEVKKVRKDVPDQTLRLLIDRGDGLVIPMDWQYQ